jgi:hypothetical protein
MHVNRPVDFIDITKDGAADTQAVLVSQPIPSTEQVNRGLS